MLRCCGIKVLETRGTFTAYLKAVGYCVAFSRARRKVSRCGLRGSGLIYVVIARVVSLDMRKFNDTRKVSRRGRRWSDDWLTNRRARRLTHLAGTYRKQHEEQHGGEEHCRNSERDPRTILPRLIEALRNRLHEVGGSQSAHLFEECDRFVRGYVQTRSYVLNRRHLLQILLLTLPICPELDDRLGLFLGHALRL